MTRLRDWGRLLRSVRYFSARQILARLFLMGRLHLYQRSPALARRGLAGPARLGEGRARLRRWLSVKFPGPPSEAQRVAAVDAAARRFTFLSRTAEWAPGQVDWRAPGMSRLWQYHLHYHDFVLSLARVESQPGEARFGDQSLALPEEWIAANPPGRRPGWEPYPLSLRVVNWAAALALLEDRSSEPRRASLARSLAEQGRFLERHLEWHLGGNHLLKNAKALFVLGIALDCPEAPRWRRRGLEIVFEEMGRQILADGGHYERSPLYHGIVLEDLLDTLALARVDGDSARVDLAELERLGSRMTDWLFRMRHPDGGLAVFNDCVESGDPGPAALLAYAQRVLGHEPTGAGSTALSASGYFILERGDGRAVIDCGEVGPDELPAHGHADTLSFELSWAGRRMVVDSGTSEYALDDLRRYVRSTAAHSTVEVDGVEQSEVWGSHRVGRRARPAAARIAEAADHARFAGAHDGYARFGVIHHRHIVATDRAWIVVDELRGRGRHRFESRLHFHPSLGLTEEGGRWSAAGERGRLRVWPLGPVRAAASEGWYCPAWGRAIRCAVLTLQGAAEAPVSFGYALVPGEDEVQLSIAADGEGVALSGRIGTLVLDARSERCTFSS